MPLKQYIKVGRQVRDEHRNVVRTLEPPPDWDKVGGGSSTGRSNVMCGKGRGRWSTISIGTVQGQVFNQLSSRACLLQQDQDHVAWLTRETVQDGHSVLIFCCSKNQCQVTAKLVARWAGWMQRSMALVGSPCSSVRAYSQAKYVLLEEATGAAAAGHAEPLGKDGLCPMLSSASG